MIELFNISPSRNKACSKEHNSHQQVNDKKYSSRVESTKHRNSTSGTAYKTIIGMLFFISRRTRVKSQV
jgi:hypothetical protein